MRFVLFQGLAASVALAGCVSQNPGEPLLDLPPNPPGCEEVVQQHRDEPELVVDEGPRPVRMGIPAACRDCKGDWVTVTFLVDESGVPDRSTMEVEGTKSFDAVLTIKKAAQEWRFAPARVGECRVPAPYGHEFRWGMDKGPLAIVPRNDRRRSRAGQGSEERLPRGSSTGRTDP